MNIVDKIFEDNGLNELIAEGARKELNLSNDWVYRDIRWLDEIFWKKLLDLLGKGNYVILMMSNKRFPDGSRGYGGQFMVSKQGMENIHEYNRSRAH